MSDHCPYSWTVVSVERARDPGVTANGRARFLRITCPYCGRDVAVNWDSTVRKHRKPT